MLQLAARLGLSSLLGGAYARQFLSQLANPDADRALIERLTTDCRSPDTVRAVAAELAYAPGKLRRVAELRASLPCPAIPLTVVSQGRSGAYAREVALIDEFRSRYHPDIASLSPLGKHVIGQGSRHLIMLDEPDLVARCVTEMVGGEARTA